MTLKDRLEEELANTFGRERFLRVDLHEAVDREGAHVVEIDVIYCEGLEHPSLEVMVRAVDVAWSVVTDLLPDAHPVISFVSSDDVREAVAAE